MLSSTKVLILFLKENPLPWLWYDEVSGKFIMVVDNHLMSTYRACPQHYVNTHVYGLRRKSKTAVTTGQRVWFLEFGIVLHEMLDKYYKLFREPDFDWISFCTAEAAKVWYAHEMDEFYEEKEYKSIGGLKGFIGLLIQYAIIFKPQNEHIHVLGTEVSFGKNREVLLHADEYFEVYLAGRMDVIIDDGYFICPMDHKSFAYFKNDPAARYATDEGPTGYIYALSTVLPLLLPEELILKRDCSKILMNLISKTSTPTPQERFKRVAIRKTAWELEQYRLRMSATAKHLLEDMERVACGLSVYRNTSMCDSWFRRECTFKDICRQQSKDGELLTIQNGFIKAPLWDTELISTN